MVILSKQSLGSTTSIETICSSPFIWNRDTFLTFLIVLFWFLDGVHFTANTRVYCFSFAPFLGLIPWWCAKLNISILIDLKHDCTIRNKSWFCHVLHINQFILVSHACLSCLKCQGRWRNEAYFSCQNIDYCCHWHPCQISRAILVLNKVVQRLLWLLQQYCCCGWTVRSSPLYVKHTRT